MNTQQAILHPKILSVCKAFEQEYDLIPAERKTQLRTLSDYISHKIKNEQAVKLIVICTHNSRRSHLGQLWLAVGADYFQLSDIQTFSGGTEATAFNIRMVRALQNIGFDIHTENADNDNPIYNIRWKSNMSPYRAFSKKYEDAPNPTTQFAAIMVCTQTDEACPFVQGCDFRLSLPYDDPKTFDNTPLEATKYEERAQQIGREMLFVMQEVRKRSET